jgi:hypothetical protein
MTKIIVRVQGGIGNQLFCYAAARRLALVNDAELVIDDVTGFVRDAKYQRRYALDCFNISCRKATPRERMEPFERYKRGLAKYIARQRPFHIRRYIEQEGIDFDPRLLELKVKGTVYLDGLWQSEGYFKDVEDLIRKDLAIIPPQDLGNKEMAERIRVCNAVAIHVRWFDVHSENSTNNVPTVYYTRAVAYMEKLAPDAHYFLFSDFPTSASVRIPLPQERITCIFHNKGDVNAYADLWLMSQCKHFIIANSTFSWWGAWLADNAAKQVIAPEFKARGCKMSWGFEGLLPKGWVEL